MRKVDLATRVVSEIFPERLGSVPSSDGPLATAGHDPIEGSLIAIGAKLYFREGYAIRVLDTEAGTLSTVAGDRNTSGTADGIGSSARISGEMYSPSMATDGTNLYFADGCRIRMFVPASAEISSLVGVHGDCASTDGPSGTARLNNPRGMAYASGFLYIVDYDVCVIRRISLSDNSVTTVAGNGSCNQSQDGLGTAAKFFYPADLAVYGSNLYVIDEEGSSSPKIRKISLSDFNVTTFLGQTGLAEDRDGPPSSALLYRPARPLIHQGILFIGNQHSIRWIKL